MEKSHGFCSSCNGSKSCELNGHPFNGDYAYLIYTSVITMFIISNLERENLKLLCSAFVSGKYRDFSDKSYSKGLSSFYFVEQ